LEPGGFKLWIKTALNVHSPPPRRRPKPNRPRCRTRPRRGAGTLGVAVQLDTICEKAIFETGISHFIGSRVETMRFQAMGHDWILNLYRGPTGDGPRELRAAVGRHLLPRRRAVAAQVDPSESNILKPGYRISGSRVETRRFQAMTHIVFTTYQAVSSYDAHRIHYTMGLN
jgi:hypothetical protein